MTDPGTRSWRADQASRLLHFGAASALPTGGFGWLTDDGVVDTGHSRPLFLAARHTYVFALAALSTGDPAHLALARAGVDALRTDYADPEHGGWYSSLDHTGQPDDTSKANYTHAHVLLAAATAVVAGVPGGPELFEQAKDIIDRRFWSDADAAAMEGWDRAFSTTEAYRGANSNMHSVEAYLVAGDVSGDSTWHTRALAIADRLINTEARAHDWHLPEHYDERWQPQLEYNSDRRDDQFRPYGATPGHAFEWTRLLITLEATLDEPPDWLVPSAVALFGAAAAPAWSPDGFPGFVYTTDWDDRPIVSQRLHWVVCEAVLAAEFLHVRTGQASYAEQAATWWRHIDDHFLDRARGGWWQELSPQLGAPPELTPTHHIWPGKPDLYHSYQALLLPDLPAAPCAALSLRGASATSATSADLA